MAGFLRINSGAAAPAIRPSVGDPHTNLGVGWGQITAFRNNLNTALVNDAGLANVQEPVVTLQHIQDASQQTFNTQKMPDSDTPADGYIEKLIKLIPSEAISLYQLGLSLLNTSAKTQVTAWGIISLLVCILFRVKATWKPEEGPQIVSVVIAAVSFMLWVPVVDGKSFFGLDINPAWSAWPTLVMALWVTVSTGLWDGEKGWLWPQKGEGADPPPHAE